MKDERTTEELAKLLPDCFNDISKVMVKHKVPKFMVPLILEWYKADVMAQMINLDGKVYAKLEKQQGDN